MTGPDDPPRERRLLVVEDNPFNQRIVGLMLTRLGYRHDFAASGELLDLWASLGEAYKKLERHADAHPEWIMIGP